MSAKEREQSLHLQVLRDTAVALAARAGPGSTLDRTVEIVARRLDFDVCSLYLLDRATGELFLAATYGLAPESVGRVRMAIGVGLTGYVAQTERPIFVSEAQKDPHFKFFPETGEERFRSFGGVPVLRRGELVGVLTVQTESSYTFHTNDVVLLQAVAHQVAGIIDITAVLVAPETQARSTPACLVGLGTSPGIARARAVVLGQASMLLPPPDEEFRGIEAELERLDRAFGKSIRHVEGRAESFRAADQSEAAAILGAHAMILRDPGLRARIEGRIRGESMPAPRAVDETFRETIQRFESKDDRLSEKVHDLLDVRMQILTRLGVAVGTEIAEDEPYIVMAEFLTPAQTADLDPDRVIGIVTEHGSETSHSSILARSRGIPAVVAVQDLLQRVRRGDVLLLDGQNGFVFVHPDEETIRQYEGRKRSEEVAYRKLADQLAAAGGGRLTAERYSLAVNLDFQSQIPAALEAGATSVGLLRTEFYYMSHTDWPTLEDLEGYFRAFFRAFRPGPVTVRLLDVGGEKRLSYVNWNPEPNPILGFRSIRFLLEHSSVHRTQVRALLRAARSEGADVRVMIPMVTAPWEVRAAREIFTEAAGEAGYTTPPPFGMMIEVPSVLFELDLYATTCDFFSVGTNDLIQYLLAVDRDNEQVKTYYNPFQPAVLRALRSVVERLSGTGRPISVCGEMAGRPLSALALMALGYTEFSLHPRALPAIGLLTFRADPPFLDGLRDEILRLPTDEQVLWELRNALRQVAPVLLGF